MCFTVVTVEAYFFTKSSTDRTHSLFPTEDKNRAFSCPSFGFSSFRSSIYADNASSTSSPKYTKLSAPPLRTTLIRSLSKSTSFISSPTHSDTRIPVPSISVSSAKSLVFNFSWRFSCAFDSLLPDSTLSKNSATSLTSKRVIALS